MKTTDRQPWRVRDPVLQIVVVLLLGISGFATWSGLRDFVSVESRGVGGGIGFEILIAATVLALTLAMYVALREVLRSGAARRRVLKPLALPLYLLLALWSVGFGYGFWWSLIAGEAASRVELEAIQSAIEDDAASVLARLETAEDVMLQAASLSTRRANRERTQGGSCGVQSGTGDGPLFQARIETDESLRALAASVAKDWADPLRADLRALTDGAIPAISTQIDAQDVPTTMVARYDRLRRDASFIASTAQSRGAAYARQLRAKASQVSVSPGEPNFYCHDPDLASALRAAADQFEGLPAFTIPDFRYSGGREGVARAVEALWLAPFRGGDAQSAAAFQGRGLVALIAAIAVDLALFVFAVFQSVAERASGRYRTQQAALDRLNIQIEGAESDLQERQHQAKTAREKTDLLRKDVETLLQRRQELEADIGALVHQAAALKAAPDLDVPWAIEALKRLRGQVERLNLEGSSTELDDLADRIDSISQSLQRNN